jgi:hypothetical protein
MLKTSYLIRLSIGSVAAILITFALGILVMWMSGFIVEDNPSTVSLTPCIFGEQKSAPLENPFSKEPLVVNCIPAEDAKPLFVQWFDRILSRRSTDQTATGASGG